MTAVRTRPADEATAITARTVLVSGGSRGIGQAVAVRLHCAGHRVAVLSRSGDGPDGCFALPCDIRSGEQVSAAVERVAQELGAVEVLVANAGVTDDRLLMRMSEPQFADVLDTNLTSAYRLTRAVVGPMAKARWGRLVFVSSVVAMQGAAGQANYAASKAGLIGLARSLAAELGGRSVTSNVVAPGFVDTDMTAALSERTREQHVSQIPLRRAATPLDIARVVGFLASEDSDYVTGAVIPVDGGLGMGH